MSRNRGYWRPPRVQNYFWLSLIQLLKGIPGPVPDGGLGTLMGNGLGLLAPSSLVLGTSLGRKGVGSRQRASRWLGAGTFLAKTVRYMLGSSAWDPVNPAFALDSAPR